MQSAGEMARGRVMSHECDVQLDRRGFSLIELVMVMLVVIILAGIAVPIYRDVVQRAEATRIIADVHTIQMALAAHLVNEQTYPPSSPAGVVPPDLVEELPSGFPFAHDNAQYRYRRWEGSEAPRLGVEIHSTNPQILRHVAALSQGRAQLAGTTSVTLVLE